MSPPSAHAHTGVNLFENRHFQNLSALALETIGGQDTDRATVRVELEGNLTLIWITKDEIWLNLIGT